MRYSPNSPHFVIGTDKMCVFKHINHGYTKKSSLNFCYIYIHLHLYIKREGLTEFLSYHSLQGLVYEVSHVFLHYQLRHTTPQTYGLCFYGHQWVLENRLLWRHKLLNEIPQQGVRWVTRAFNQFPTDSR